MANICFPHLIGPSEENNSRALQRIRSVQNRPALLEGRDLFSTTTPARAIPAALGTCPASQNIRNSSRFLPWSQHNEPEQRHPPLPGTAVTGNGPYPASSDTYQLLKLQNVCAEGNTTSTLHVCHTKPPFLLLHQQTHLLSLLLWRPRSRPPSAASCSFSLTALETRPAAAPSTQDLCSGDGGSL